MRIKLICILLMFLFANSTFANAELDSLKIVLAKLPDGESKAGTYNEISFSLRRKDPQTALKYAQQGLSLAQKLDSKKWIITISNTIAIIYRNTDEFDKGVEIATKAAAMAAQFKDKKLICSTTNTLASLYNIIGNYELAQKNYFIMLKMAEEMKDESIVSKALGNIANLYVSRRKVREALGYNLKSLEIKQRIGTPEEVAGSCQNVGFCYFELGVIDSGYTYHSKALKIYSETGDKYGMAGGYNHLGYYYELKKQFEKAIDFQNKALAIQQEIQDSVGMIYSYKNIAEVYALKGNLKKSLEYLKITEAIAVSVGVMEEQVELFRTISKTYEELNDYKNALFYFKKHKTAADSIITTSSGRALIEMQTKYDTDKKEQKLALQKAQIEKKDVEAKQSRTQRNGLIAGLGLLLLFSVFIYRSLQQNKKAKHIIELQKLKVDEAYEELNQQNEEIAAQRDEIEKQKDLVEEHQKETLDSIHYAKRIQRALLTSKHYIQKHLNDFFILYKPKDIVSGDFYWVLQKDDSLYFAVADCTGHGVPGAFMSMIGINLLNEIILERNISNPALVLDIMREEIIRNLNPEGAEEESKDGMDMILAKFNFITNTLEYAAANNAFYIVRDAELIVQKADKMPVGKYHDKVESFTKRTLQLQKGDTVYLITDGYADQFGGPKGKKFKYKQLEDLFIANTNSPSNNQHQILDTAFDTWKGALEQVDDVTIVGIKI